MKFFKKENYTFVEYGQAKAMVHNYALLRDSGFFVPLVSGGEFQVTNREVRKLILEFGFSVIVDSIHLQEGF